MTIPRARTLCFPALLAGLLLAAAGLAEHHEGDVAPPNERVVLGAMGYRIHCLNCHGSSGAGDGPMAELLKISPADLTRLAKENGGKFPGERVYRAIDGRGEIGAHGTRDMPVWGIGFQNRGRDSDQEETVRAKILDLVAYLETLQGDGEKPGSGSDG